MQTLYQGPASPRSISPHLSIKRHSTRLQRAAGRDHSHVCREAKVGQHRGRNVDQADSLRAGRRLEAPTLYEEERLQLFATEAKCMLA